MSAGSHKPAAPRPPLPRFLQGATLGACALVLLLMRSHAFDLPLETDEANYAYVGTRLAAGDRLYVDVWDHQPPGVFVLFAAVAWAFGNDPFVFRWLAAAFSLATMVMIWAILDRRGPPWVALGAALMFALASSDPGTAGEGCNREMFMSALIVGAWWSALRHHAARRRDVLIAGVMLGLASILKTVVVVHWMALAAWILVDLLTSRATLSEPRASARADHPSRPPRPACDVDPASRRPAGSNIGESRLSAASAAPGDAGEDSAHTGASARAEARGSLEQSARAEARGSLEQSARAEARGSLGQSARAEARGSPREILPATGLSPVAGVLWLAIGPLLLWAGVFAYFGLTDRWDTFVDAVFRFNLGYSGADTGRLSRFAAFFQPERHPFIFDSALPIWIGGAVAIVPLASACRARSRASSEPRASARTEFPTLARPPVAHGDTGAIGDGQRRFSLAVVLLMAASYAAVCLPAQFWPHYYYLMVPALVLAVSAAVCVHVVPRRNDRMRAWGSGAVLTLVLALLFATQWREYLSREGLEITIKRYNTRDYWARAHGWNVARVTDPDDAIFVFGNDAGIYYYSQRRCASRFTMATGLRDRYPGAAGRRATLLDELRSTPPRLILETGEPAFPGWIEFLQERYTPVGADFHDKTGKVIMPVWCRRDAPIPAIDWDWDRSEAAK